MTDEKSEEMAKSESIESLKSLRASTKGCITRIKNVIEQKGDNLSTAEIECRLGILEAYFKQYLSYQTSLEKLLSEQECLEEVKNRAEIEELFVFIKTKLLSLPCWRRSSAADIPPQLSFVSPNPTNKLPKLRLPQFTGKYSEFPNFYGCFKQLVHDNDSLTTLEKFNHLVTCLSGPALNTIKAFELTENNYNKAVEYLVERYHNKYLIFQEHVIELFNLPKISKNSASQLRQLIDDASAHLSALTSLGNYEDITNAFITYLVHSKLDTESQSYWEDKADFSKLPSWKDCATRLNLRCQYLESRGAKSSNAENVRVSPKGKHTPTYSTNVASSTKSSYICIFCNSHEHLIYHCMKFKRLSALERFAEIKKRSACINCLRIGHSVKQCRAIRCRVCDKSHHTLLHIFSSNTNSSEREIVAPQANSSMASTQVSPAAQASSQTSCVSQQSNEQLRHVFLATAVVRVKDKQGNIYYARALLDSASQLDLISENLAQILKLKRTKIDSNLFGVGISEYKLKYCAELVVQSCVNDFQIASQAYIIPNITSLQPGKRICIDDWKIPSNIKLADPQFFKPQKIDLLLGASHFFKLLCVGQIELGKQLPVLQKTVLGWIVSGSFDQTEHKSISHNVLNCNGPFLQETNTVENEPKLTELVERFWEEENVSTCNENLSEEHIMCEKIFIDNVRKAEDGKYMVKLPFKASPQKTLGDSFDTAKKRFLSLERRLNKDPNLKRQYSEFLEEYRDAGHMELLDESKVPQSHYFMPHQCVLRPESTTTKLRVVFDASCRTSSLKSLNDILMIGPTTQPDLFSIIFRFRFKKYALMADISAMYRQIWVYPEDTYYQLILWREKSEERLQCYRLKTVTYGTAPAPFLATRCLLELAKEHESSNPEVANIIKTDFYMDDLITGADTSTELHSIKSTIENIFSSAQLKLRKWYSNDSTLLVTIPEEDQEKLKRIKDLDVVKALGIQWDPKHDHLRISYQADNTVKKCTKRAILSQIAKIFDPLGLINPVTVKAKIFMQELWLKKLEWDESLPLSMESNWKAFLISLEQLNKIKIPRYILSNNNLQRIEIHGFADASIRAYGCCFYTRTIDIFDNVDVKLLTAKSKVAPIKTVRSLPCLELCATLLLARLWKKIESTLVISYDKIYLWSDSIIVLSWLSSHPSSWKTFVANRTAEIQRLTTKATWRHVDSKNNPADIISRGAEANELLSSSSIWFSGPAFLREPPEFWPSKTPCQPYDATPERKRQKTILVCSVLDDFVNIIYNCSDFLKNCRRFALVLRFINNLKQHKQRLPLTKGSLIASEIDNAFIHVVYCIQQTEFKDEIQALQQREHVNHNSAIKNLNAFLDTNSSLPLLRVGGRLRNANISFDNKYPILLPKKNQFTKSYVKYLHLKNLHAGPSALVGILRERFWVINAREYTRQIVRSCIECFRCRPQLIQQIMGDLPEGRVNFSLPFTHCGVDFCGPFLTTLRIRGKQLYKSYVALFVCFATKAVHIEVVSDLSSAAFIAALKRFIARRNRCKHIYCDNATNFIGAKRQLQEFKDSFLHPNYQADITKWCADNSINFHPIPPRSPHFGGLWEAAIKAAKNHLYRTTQGYSLTFEELTTVMAQIEAALNSRPITALPSDPSDDFALTPAHFLTQAPISSFPEPDITIKNSTYLSRWQRITLIFQLFWNRWSKEYVRQLQNRYRWQKVHPDIKPDTVVLIHQDDLPPFKWKLGRVIRTVKGSDGHIRVVEIKTSSGVLQRAVHKIAPLPMDEED